MRDVTLLVADRSNADLYDYTISLYTRRPATCRDLTLFCARTCVPLDCVYLSATTYLYIYVVFEKEREREKKRERETVYTMACFIPARNKMRLTPRLPRGKLVKL